MSIINIAKIDFAPGSGGGEEILNQDKTVNPAIEQQSVTADEGYTGLGTVTVEPVTAAIDSNIQAGNIKKDVNILGVVGNYDAKTYATIPVINIEYPESVEECGTFNISGPDQQLKTAYDKDICYITNDGFDSPIPVCYKYEDDEPDEAGRRQYGMEFEGQEYYYYISFWTDANGDVIDGGDFSNIYEIGYQNASFEEANVTPTTEEQEITPTEALWFNKVNVSAVDSSIDNNIQAGNIKKDVTILGVTGTLEEGIEPTGSMNITANGTYNVTSYASAVVDVPTEDRTPELIAGTISGPIAYGGNSMKPYTFYSCSNITEFSAPNIKVIPQAAFQGCSSLSKIYAPQCWYISLWGLSGVKKGCEYTFNQVGDKYLRYDSSAWNVGSTYTYLYSSMWFADSSYKYLFNASSAFSKSSIILPSTTEYMAESQFSGYGTKSFKYVEGENVKFIPGYCFYSNSQLLSVSFPNALSIGYGAFSICTNLSEVNIGSNVKSISSYAFNNCSNLSTVLNIPNVSSIGYYAFWNCKSLEFNNSFPKLLYLSSYTFGGCYNIKSFTAPLVQFLPEGCFKSCYNLSYVSLDACTSINASYQVSIGVFYDCSALAEVYMPNLSWIPSMTFRSCPLLSSINFQAVRAIADTAFSGTALTSIRFEDFSFIEYIGSGAFQYCSNLSYASFNANKSTREVPITSLYERCFANCTNLEKITFSQNYAIESKNVMLSIYKSCFSNCNKLSQIYINTRQMGALSADAASVFTSTPILDSSYLGYYGSIYVPASLVTSYKSATNWIVISDRITAIPEE